MSAKTKRQYIDKLKPEWQAAIPAWNQKWIDIIMSTQPMDRQRAEWGVRGMYQAAGLAQPIVVFVPSPLVLCLAGPIAAGIWYLREHGLPCSRHTSDATSDATRAATRAATYAATRAATDAATYAATDAATDDDGLPAVVRFLLQCCSGYYNMWNAGNQWASWCGFLSFFRDICGLRLPAYDNYAFYEAAAVSAGPRIMHAKFCMISDRPEVLHTQMRDGAYVAHCEDGPSHRWRDGWELFHINGVKVDRQIVMSPGTQTVDQIRREQNAEVKRIRIERFGWDRYMVDAGAKKIDARRNDIDGTDEMLCRCEDETVIVLHCRSTARRYVKRVPREISTCEQAQNWMSGGLSRRTIDAA